VSAFDLLNKNKISVCAYAQHFKFTKQLKRGGQSMVSTIDFWYWKM